MYFVFSRCIFITLFLAALIPANFARSEMSSTNYQIYADSIGIDGGVYSSSTSFTLFDTIGESPAGTVTSTSYELSAGFQTMERGTLSVSVSASSLDLGTLSKTQVKSASTNVTVSTNASTGYSLSISSATGIMPSAVSDGTVSAGSEEYGMSVSGSNAAFTNDRSVTSGRVLASATVPVINDITTLTFKASISSASAAAANDNQAITLTVSANL